MQNRVLKQISDDEGSPQINPPCSYSVRYEFARAIPLNKIREKKKYVPQLLLDLHKLFSDLGYSVSNIYRGRVYRYRKEPKFSISWAFDVQGKHNLERFVKEIHFRVPKRKEKLEYGLGKMKIDTYGKKAQHIALKCFYEILQQNDHVTKHELAKQMKRTKRNAEAWLCKLEGKGFIKRVGGNNFIGGEGGFCSLAGRVPLRYTITKRGKKYIKTKQSYSPKIIPTPVNRNERIYFLK